MINQNIERTRRGVARKLAPSAIRTSTVVRSLLAYLVNECWSEPYIVHLQCAEDGMLMAYESDSESYLRLLCRRDDLLGALLILAHMANLTPGERTYLLSKVPSVPKSSQRTRN
jgi:hypothetical protein